VSALGFTGGISEKQGGSPVRQRYSTIIPMLWKLPDPTKVSPRSFGLSNITVGSSRQNFTMAARSELALYALDAVADVLDGHPPGGRLMATMDALMRADPVHWQRY
jgi:hypothetical protein